MAGESVTDWVANKLDPVDGLTVVDRTPENFLILSYNESRRFPVAVIGERTAVQEEHVRNILSHATKPEFVLNVPSTALWTGAAISMVHAAPAAFGTLGDLRRAALSDNVPMYRNKTYAFFDRAIAQHSKVYSVTRIYDEMFEAEQKNRSVKIALVETYNMSAEDVRFARARFGKFDVAVKTTSYGSITAGARAAAASMGAEAMMFRELMQFLAR